MFEVILFTNRCLIVFDERGKQHYLQEAVDCYDINNNLLEELLTKPAKYYLSRWREWRHEITKKEFEYLLGKRTKDKDIAEVEILVV